MYTTLEDLLKLMPENDLLDLTDDAGSGDVQNPAVRAVVDEAIVQASREIDGYLGERYSVPLSPVPELIGVIASRMAVRHLHMRRGRPLDVWEEDYRQRLRQLVRISEGKMAIGASQNGVSQPSGTVRTTGGGRRFRDLDKLY